MSYTELSGALSPADLQQIEQAISQLRAAMPFLVNLSKSERISLPKMGERSVNFVEKSLAYTDSHPQFAPRYLNPDEFGRYVALSRDLRYILQLLRPLIEGVDDTAIAVGHESLKLALQYYHSVKYARESRNPGADAVYDDLRQRYPGRGKGKKEPIGEED